MLDARQAAVRHWQARPCGTEAALDIEEGSPGFFQATDRNRYTYYAPWLSATAQWNRFADRDVLEVGCGTGADLEQFAVAGARVSGVDLVPRHLALTSRRFALAGLRAHLARADAEHLPYADASFDAVYSFGVIHHTTDMTAAAREIRRVLRPGGTAIVAVYNLLSVNMALTLLALWQEGYLFREPLRTSLARIEGASGDGPVVRALTSWQLRRLLRGFRLVEVQTRHVAWTGRRRPPFQSWIERHLGWYLWAEAR